MGTFVNGIDVKFGRDMEEKMKRSVFFGSILLLCPAVMAHDDNIAKLGAPIESVSLYDQFALISPLTPLHADENTQFCFMLDVEHTEAAETLRL